MAAALLSSPSASSPPFPAFPPTDPAPPPPPRASAAARAPRASSAAGSAGDSARSAATLGLSKPPRSSGLRAASDEDAAAVLPAAQSLAATPISDVSPPNRPTAQPPNEAQGSRPLRSVPGVASGSGARPPAWLRRCVPGPYAAAAAASPPASPAPPALASPPACA